MSENLLVAPPAPDPRSDIAARIAAGTAARRSRPDYEAEVRLLLDAARKVIAATGRARVADIVTEAGLSNDAFYRHFPSKDALIAALTEESAAWLAHDIARQMAEEATPEEQIARWLDGMLERTAGPKASWTSSLLNASGSFSTAIPTGAHEIARLPFSRLLEGPFTQLGSTDPALDAELVTHAITSRGVGHLRASTEPSDAERAHLLRFCLATPTDRAPTDRIPTDRIPTDRAPTDR